MTAAISKTIPQFRLRAAETGTVYWIYVEAPDAKTEPGPWPAVLFLDGDDQFRHAVKAYRSARKAGEVSPLLLVGVGYGAGYIRPGNRRQRDYTPTAMRGEPGTGGGDDFLEFLTERLWHELAGRFPVDEEARGLAGHSLGALLVLHALFQKKPFFNRLLAIAPSIWFDERSILHQAAKLREKQKKLPGRLFLGVGGEDSPSTKKDLARLQRQLKAHPFAQLEVVSRRFAGKGHYDALQVAFREGLRVLFPAE
ncbi:MAG: alpha/beta hydrolase-fold protein [Opitutaceae bacterium]|nr:alpha/beta hydrolase-fold protein [Opitutaceae bacterium]